VIFGILVGFLANDVWDRSRRAAAAVRSEAANLTSLYDLLYTSGLPALPIDRTIRTYVSTVVEKEWPAMARGEAAPEAESAQDQMLEAVANLEAEPKSSPAITRVMLDTALKNSRRALRAAPPQRRLFGKLQMDERLADCAGGTGQRRHRAS